MVIHLLKKDGHITDQRNLDQCCAYLPNGEYVATIEPKEQWEKRQPRTLSQNALLHLWCRYIANALNAKYAVNYWDTDRVKEEFAVMFATEEVRPDGRTWRRPVSTSKMTKKQMHEYMERIQAEILVEEGITVPLPDDERFKDFQDIYQ